MAGEHMMSGRTLRGFGLVSLEKIRQKEDSNCFPLFCKGDL